MQAAIINAHQTQNDIGKCDVAWKFLDSEYELLSILGEGTYGKVIKARHRQSGQECAIKHIKDVFFNIYEAKKILREIHILRKLTNDQSNLFTVKLLDVIVPPIEEDDKQSNDPSLLFNSLFLVQDCFGLDLSHFIRNSNKFRLQEEHILTIVYNILCGVHYMHSAHVVHRDIKPANLLINQDCNVRICDLGLARSIKKHPASSQNKEKQLMQDRTKNDVNSNSKNTDIQQQMTARVGSRFYRAPEIIICQNDYDYSVDIWSIGCILGELLLNFVEDHTSQGESKHKGDQNTKLSNYFMFPGDSCYPISPCSKNTDKNSSYLSENDQLIKIFELLGKPSERDLRFLDGESKQKYIKSICTSFNFESKIESKFPKSSPEIKQLLKELLILNPNDRKSAEELLNLDIFKNIGDASHIIQAAHKIQVITDDAESMDSNDNKNFAAIQKLILKESKKVRKTRTGPIQ